MELVLVRYRGRERRTDALAFLRDLGAPAGKTFRTKLSRPLQDAEFFKELT